MDQFTVFLIIAAVTVPILLIFSNMVVCDKSKDGRSSWTFNPVRYKCDALYMLLISSLWTFLVFYLVNKFMFGGGDAYYGSPSFVETNVPNLPAPAPAAAT